MNCIQVVNRLRLCKPLLIIINHPDSSKTRPDVATTISTIFLMYISVRHPSTHLSREQTGTKIMFYSFILLSFYTLAYRNTLSGWKYGMGLCRMLFMLFFCWEPYQHNHVFRKMTSGFMHALYLSASSVFLFKIFSNFQPRCWNLYQICFMVDKFSGFYYKTALDTLL